MWALVPLKELEQAKARLAEVLCADERRALMFAMARDVLTTLSRCKHLGGILLVSRAPEADSLAQMFGTERFTERPTADLSEALIQASDYLISQLKATAVMIVPADVPLITADEVAAIVGRHDQVTVVPDNENLGTNCLICTPPNRIPYAFDGRSFAPHVDAAFAAGINPIIAPAAGFALDIDTPDDLRELVEKDPASQTGTYLVKSGITRRLMAADNDSQMNS